MQVCLTKLHGSTSLGRDHVPVSARLSTEPKSCLHGIRNQSFRWLKLGRKVPFLMQRATILNFCSFRILFFLYWGAEELCSLLKKWLPLVEKQLSSLICAGQATEGIHVPHSLPIPSFIRRFQTPAQCPHISPKWRSSFPLLTLPPVLAPSLRAQLPHYVLQRQPCETSERLSLLFKERIAYHYLSLKGNLCFVQENN